MISNEQIVNELVEKVTSGVVGDIKQSINKIIEDGISDNLSKVMLEGEFYKTINNELQKGLTGIYKEITSVNNETGSNVSMDKKETEELFSEASEQLDAIVQTTEKATEDIMEVIEKHMDLQAKSGKLLKTLKEKKIDDEGIETLIESNKILNNDLMELMTLLSFQDLTGQRIKRIIHALKQVQTTVFELFMSTGLKIKAKESAPEKAIDEIEEEAKSKMSELKGPQTKVSQADVDDLLAELFN